MSISVRVLDASSIEQLAPMKKCIDLVEGAFRAFASDQATMPPKVYLNVPAGDFRAMPSYLQKSKVAGLKWVNVHPNNKEKGLPTVMAMMLVNDAETGLPLALLEGGLLTALRTGAAGGVAARHLARKSSSRALLLGAGIQAYYQALALSLVYEIEKFSIFDLSQEAADRLARKLADDISGRVSLVSDLEKACKETDIIVTTTPARQPVLHRVPQGTHINAIGADAVGKRELSSEIITSSRIFVDDIEQASHSGEVNVPLSDGTLQLSDLAATLGEVITGAKTGRNNEEDITIFDSTGLAIQDLAVAAHVLAEAEKQNLGQVITL